MPKSALAEVSCDILFAATLAPMIIADAHSGSIVRANAAAAHLFGISCTALEGMPLPTMLESCGSVELRAALDTARLEGVAQTGNVRVRGAVLDSILRLSLVRAGGAYYVLVQFCSIQDELDLEERLHGAASLVYEAIDKGNTALAVTDADFNLLYANGAFLRLIAVDSLHDARSHGLLHWLQLSGADVSRMRAQMANRETATTLSIRPHARPPGSTELQALAIAAPDGPQPLWGFSISERLRLH